MEGYELWIGGAGVLGFIGTLITLIVNGRKSKAEIEKLIADTELVRLNAQHELQTQLDELREQNKKLFVEREQEREAKDKLRAELNRLHEKISELGRELQTERERNVYLNIELEKQRNSNIKKSIQIEGLEALVSQHEKTIASIHSEVFNIKKQTGSLVSQWERRKTE